jgi:superfamily II DNA or RNA helicase
MQISPCTPLQPGQRVSVRRARWTVVDVRRYDGCELVTIAPIGSSTGSERQFLTPFDDVVAVDRDRRLRLVRAAPWRRACRALLAGDVTPGSLRSVRAARIDLMPHQLEPALAIVRGLGSRLLLADEVGLGKTIQAAIVVAELLARGLADRVLVITPAGLRRQWARELSTRFGIEGRIADAAALRRAAAVLPVGMNPWAAEHVALASIDYVKRPEVLAAAAAVPWDIVIVDEAHASASDSDRRGAVAALTATAAYVLLLTATPHSGDRQSFASLCGLGAVNQDPLLVFRRRRGTIRGGAARRVHALAVRPTSDESRMHAMLGAYTAALKVERADAWLAATVLHKRALSSAWALARSIERRLDGLSADAQSPRGAAQLLLPLDDRDGESCQDDEPPLWPAGLGLADRERERRLLRSLAGAARAAAAHESKLSALARLLRRAKEPAIVFTEYRDTLVHVQQALGRPAALIHGGLTQDERSAALHAFTSRLPPLLLATDAAGEGLNLQQASRLVINLELPWNPMRLEQRIGRVDRIGQQRTVHAIHLVAAGTGESRILGRLGTRIAQAQADITAAGVPASDEERAIAQLAILGTSDESLAAPEPPPIDLTLRCPDLHADAASETHRLARARALTISRDEHGALDAVPSGPWILRTRRSKARAALGSRAVLIWRAGYEDAFGRMADSTLVPVQIDLDITSPLADAAAIERWLASIDVRCRDAIGHATAGWRGLVERTNGALMSARLARERGIAEQADVTRDALFQPGLFERRAERRRLIAAAARQSAATDRTNRLHAIEGASRLTEMAPRLLLVLMPYRA